MRILKAIGIVLLVLFVIVLAISALAPAKMKIEESIIIDAPASIVFDQVNDFKNWEAWSPWANRDPEMKPVFSEPSSGQGAWMTWDSKKVGSGKQAIEVSEPYRHVITKLNFTDWEGDNFASFFIEEVPEGSIVTWSMDGAPLPFLLRGFGLFMTKMVKKDYREGLENLKKVCEAKPKELH